MNKNHKTDTELSKEVEPQKSGHSLKTVESRSDELTFIGSEERNTNGFQMHFIGKEINRNIK